MITQTGTESELIYRQQAIDALNSELTITGRTNAEAAMGYVRLVKDRLERLPSAQPEIIHCKDCAKHNKGVGDFEVLSDGKRSWIWKDQACPLVSWRGKAQGHEFDCQYCAYAKRRTDG